ncbi:thioredoxin family protein [Candidatus Sumerlaeota bacterium]|nr:thioredoxin family protein [Candidatus Sumerlaeota bacterium]
MRHRALKKPNQAVMGLCVMLWIVGASLYARAAAPVHDPFTTSSDGSLDNFSGFSGDKGFNGKWTSPNTEWKASTQREFKSYPTNANFPNPSPGRLQLQYGSRKFNMATRPLDPAAFSIDFAQDAEYYYSFLARVTYPDDSLTVGFQNQANPLQYLEVGVTGKGQPIIRGLTVMNGTEGLIQQGGQTPDQAYFYVVKIVAKSNDSDQVFMKAFNLKNDRVVKPEDLNGEGASNSNWTLVSRPFSSRIRLDAVRLSGKGNFIRFDEFRAGYNWEDVTGVRSGSGRSSNGGGATSQITWRVNWEVDFKTAARRALDEEKPLLIYFYHKDVQDCIDFEQDILNGSKFPIYAQGLVCVKLDVTENRTGVQTFGIDRVPWVLIGRKSGGIAAQSYSYHKLPQKFYQDLTTVLRQQ